MGSTPIPGSTDESPYSSDILNFFGNCRLVDAEFIRELDSVEQTFWGQILEKRADKRIAEIINEAYGVDIEHFTMGSYV